MIVVIDKTYDKKKVDRLLSEIKPEKLFDARKFAGKIKWDEDPLAYQKRMRDEWD
jgi:hypothetical protein